MGAAVLGRIGSPPATSQHGNGALSRAAVRLRRSGCTAWNRQRSYRYYRGEIKEQSMRTRHITMAQALVGFLKNQYVEHDGKENRFLDRKSTRLNSSHLGISY